MKQFTLNALQYNTTDDFDKNLQKLVRLIKKTPTDSIICAPEVSLTHFSYDRFDEAADFSGKATEELLALSTNKIITITMTEKRNGRYFNMARVFYQNKIVFERAKHKLFPLDGEPEHYTPGEEGDVKIFEVAGIKFGVLVCFELRFVELWAKLKGADIILIPAMWGKPRKKHFEQLCEALSLTNQCYVVASDSSNKEMASSSAVITPSGVSAKDDRKSIISLSGNLEEIERVRRYLPIDIKLNNFAGEWRREEADKQK